MVAALRTEAGRNPYDRGLSDLVGELCTRSEEFSVRWASHNVRFHRSGLKDVHHPAVGDLHLSFEAMELPGDPGLSLIVYSATRLRQRGRLVLLASWAATLDQAGPNSSNETNTEKKDRAQANQATQHPWSGRDLQR